MKFGRKLKISIKINIGWYGTSREARQATADIKSKKYTEADIQEIAQKVSFQSLVGSLR